MACQTLRQLCAVWALTWLTAACAHVAPQTAATAPVPQQAAVQAEPAPVESTDSAPLPTCAPDVLAQYAIETPEQAAFERGARAMFQEFRERLIRECTFGGCRFNMPEDYDLMRAVTTREELAGGSK